MTTHGRGLFVEMGASREAQVVLTQTYVAVIVVVALLIARRRLVGRMPCASGKRSAASAASGDARGWRLNWQRR